MKSFHLTISKVGESLYEGDADSITLKCADGEVTVLADHEPYVAPVVPCTAVIYDSKEHRHDIAFEHPGVIEVSNNQVTVIL
jgi:F0F1-type ATP synthase epsilon subunit